jgi:two-component system, NarL family, sensor histidine kinase UhpB
MSLRLKLNLIVGVLTTLFVAALIGVQVVNMRASVAEEVVASNRVAAQLLNRTAWLAAAQGTPAMLAYLQGLGRVRSNDLVLQDAVGRELYRSPPSPYKAGRDAPDWFAALITPQLQVQSFSFPDGKLVVQANASRAAVDAWDAFMLMAGIGLALIVVANALVFWVVGRTVRPFARITQALGELEAGRLDARLPALPGREAGAIGAAFNRMAQSVRQQLEAEHELSDRRDLARWVDHHIEQERRAIARELHDEFGQSVTAIKSLALAVAQRSAGRDDESQRAATLIAGESTRLYDAMHGLIPRLAPTLLDRFGLVDALRDLVERARASQPGITIEATLDAGDAALSHDAALALYRAAQEGITNAVRHAKPQHIRVELAAQHGTVSLRVTDDGSGLADGWAQREGHYGLRWLRERVAALGGQFAVAAAPGRGVRLDVTMPAALHEEPA